MCCINRVGVTKDIRGGVKEKRLEGDRIDREFPPLIWEAGVIIRDRMGIGCRRVRNIVVSPR